ncbi:MAG: hypothetical protein WDN24_09500 [Sphingomonas sp.]
MIRPMLAAALAIVASWPLLALPPAAVSRVRVIEIDPIAAEALIAGLSAPACRVWGRSL